MTSFSAKRRMSAIFSLALFCSQLLPLFAEVYMLRPGKEPDSGAEGQDEAMETSDLSAPTEHKLWTEPLIINGISLELDVSLVEETLDFQFDYLKQEFPDAKLSRNSNSFLFERESGNGLKERIYSVETGAFFPSMRFSMEIPKSLPQDFVCPMEIPIPPDSTPKLCIQMPARNSASLVFSSEMEPYSAMCSMQAQLLSNGWKQLEQSIPLSSGAKSLSFAKGSPMSVIFVEVQESGTGSSGSCFMKTLQK